jgi:hypothetical protein
VKYAVAPEAHDIPVISMSPAERDAKPVVKSIAIKLELPAAVPLNSFTNTKLSGVASLGTGVYLNILTLKAASTAYPHPSFP